MDAVKDLALRLLEREPPPGPVMDPARYVAGSLPGLLAAMARPGGRADGPALGSLCLKYAYAYVHPDRIGEDVSLEAVTELAGQFARRRGGCRALAGRGELRRLLLHHGFALQMLLDLPKTVHLLTALVAAASRVRTPEGFLGLDCGAGTGILLLGHFLLAGRLGVAGPSLWGIEHLPAVAERADGLLSALGVGRVVCGDATASAIYDNLPQGPVACLTNETLPSRGRRLYKEPFTAISQAFFAALGDRLRETAFVPEAVWASEREGRWLRLAPENAFAGEGGQGKPARLFVMADVELAGRRLPADRVGEPFAALLAPPWREILGRRW